MQLIEDILDGSRIITGKLHLEVISTDLTAIVRTALDGLAPAADAKAIAMAVRLEPSGARILADPDRLQQIVWNLVNNALKFTPKGGRIEIAVAKPADPETLVRMIGELASARSSPDDTG